MTEQQTPDREKKIAEIREALEKATPGPWYVSENGFSSKRSCPTVYATDEELRYIAFCDDSLFFTEPTPNLANAHLIANAPEWLRFLLDELERLKREYAEERAAHNAHVTELCELEQERDKLIEGLRWYAEADYDHKIMTDYYEDDGGLFYGTELDLDRGQRARNILREIGVTMEW